MTPTTTTRVPANGARVILRVDRVSFSYQQPVLIDVTFEASAGEIVALVGPNGSGKTTLMHLIRGLLQARGGQIRLANHTLVHYPRRRLAQLIGYVLQEHAIAFPITVAEYVMLGRFCRIRGIGFESAEDRRALNRALRATDTIHLTARPMQQLSGGERQRVMLARALVGEPTLLLLDEPTANLDIAYQVEMMNLIRRWTREAAGVSIVVTHELNLASEFADRILLLHAGKRFAFGTPGQVVTEKNLQEVFGARFLVDVNPESAAPRVTITANGPAGRATSIGGDHDVS